MWEGSDKIFPDRVGNFFVYTSWKLGSSLSCKLPIYIYNICYLHMCVGQRAGGHGRITEYAGHIIHQSTWHTQCSEENAGKYDRNDDTHLYCTSLQAAVQLRATNAASMKAQWARAAHALHTQRFCAAHAPLTLAVWNGRYSANKTHKMPCSHKNTHYSLWVKQI